MSEMLPFAFVDFYDAPRCIVLRHRGRVLLLQSAFNEEADEYEGCYSVYLVADSVEEMAKAGNWTFLACAKRELLGEVRLQDVTFDPTRCKCMDADILDAILGRLDSSAR